jgi:uncharacterized protein Smg (DUF494 family)
MKNRILEMLIRLIDGAEQDWNSDLTDSLVENLVNRGYSEEEIEELFSWLFETAGPTSERVHDEVTVINRCLRVLHGWEKMVLLPESFGYLLRLEQFGLLNNDQMEIIIEKAILTGERGINLDRIKSIAASVILYGEGSPSPKDGFSLPDDVKGD